MKSIVPGVILMLVVSSVSGQDRNRLIFNASLSNPPQQTNVYQIQAENVVNDVSPRVNMDNVVALVNRAVEQNRRSNPEILQTQSSDGRSRGNLITIVERARAAQPRDLIVQITLPTPQPLSLERENKILDIKAIKTGLDHSSEKTTHYKYYRKKKGFKERVVYPVRYGVRRHTVHHKKTRGIRVSCFF